MKYKLKRKYIIKDFALDYLKKNHITNRKISQKSGIKPCYISQIRNRRRLIISDTFAYAFSKAISSDFEISDVFDIQ